MHRVHDTPIADSLRTLLEAVKQKSVSVEEAMSYLDGAEKNALGFATPDHLRARRTGFPEVIFCPGKTDAQIASIAVSIAKRSPVVLATRATPEVAEALARAVALGLLR